MAAFFTLLFSLFSLCAYIPISTGAFSDEISDVISTKTQEKTTHLHFFFHDIHSGANPSVLRIARGGAGTPFFGDTYMLDNALTEGPDLSSKLVGRAQGMYGFESQGDVSLFMVFNCVFSEGKYNGSSISILGWNLWTNEERELPVVGGSGIFRLARGYALLHTVWIDIESGDATVEYDVYLQHFESSQTVAK